MNEIEDNFIKTVTEIIEADFSFDLANYSPQLKPILSEWKTSHPEENFPLPALWELEALDAIPDLREERKLGEPYFRPKI